MFGENLAHIEKCSRLRFLTFPTREKINIKLSSNNFHLIAIQIQSSAIFFAAVTQKILQISQQN